MKFVCDKCHTRYSISDEKVKGKVLKIRCKTCGNIIVVREQGAESATAVGVEGRGAAPRTEVEMPRAAVGGGGSGGGGGGMSAAATAGANIEWFVAIKGKQHGPMRHDQLVEFYRQGRVHERSYCWHEDLPGWTRMKELPDFAEAIAQGQAPAGAPTPPPPPPEDEAGAEVVDLQKHRQQRQAAEAHRAPASDPGAVGGAADPFAQVGGVAGAMGAPAVDGAPRESTRVFIMNAGLHNRSKKHKTYAIVASVTFVGLVSLMGLDYMGIVRIPFLGDAALAIADYAGVEGAAEKKKKRKLLAQWEDGDLDPEAACKFLGDCPKANSPRGRRTRTGGGTGGELTDDMFQTGGPGESGLVGRGDIGPDGKPIDPMASNSGASEAIKSKFLDDGREFTRVNDRKGNKDRDIAVGGGGGPNPEAMAKVVGRGMGGIKACIERAAKQGSKATGKQKLLLVIQRNGRVRKARILDGPTAASPLGECIAKSAKKWKFPPFGGKEFELEVPLVLTAN